MLIYILIAFLVVYLLFKECQSLGCGNIFDREDCNNANGKAVRGTAPTKSDTNSELLDKINFAGEYQSRFVKWRISVLVALTSVMIFVYFAYNRLATEKELLLGGVIITLILTLMFNFYSFHLDKYIVDNIKKCTDHLRKM